jgi:nucleotide-binding universal stress UspA family protein
VRDASLPEDRGALAARKREAGGFRHVLVPLSGDPDDELLMRAAHRLAQMYKAKLSVVYVIEVPMALPVDVTDLPEAAKAEQVLERAEQMAAGTDVTATCLQAREAGHAIVEQAIDAGADLIFMGVHVRHRMGVVSLGRTATYVLRRAPCTVWVSRWVESRGEA